ncbi:MAG: type V CRISPR-associated protein Cas4 [Bacilli bacterium]
MENPISISKINDFIYCPVSIYFHDLNGNLEEVLYQNKEQLDGTRVHKFLDEKKSTDRNILQATKVYSDEYNLIGCIDVYNISEGILTERKKHISVIYDGYVFQLYAQYFCLVEMGYDVKSIQLYSYSDNRTYSVLLPSNDSLMCNKFKTVLREIELFSFNEFKQNNELKCKKCIYEELCSFSIKGDENAE